jgi:ABC-2 type transport system permease protein
MKLYGLYVGQRLKARLAYRGDFLLTVLGDVLLAAVGLAFLSTLFAHIPALGSWSRAEVLVSWGFSEAVIGFFFVLFGGLFSLNQRYIVGGELDRVLVRPVDPYAQVLLDNLSWEDLPIALLGLGVIGWCAGELPALSLPELAFVPVLIAGGVAVLGGVMTAVASIGFHLHHRGTAVGLVFQVSTFTRYPMDLFAVPLRYFLTFVLPLGFAGFYPATFLMSRPEWRAYALASPVVGLVAMGVGLGAFRFGLRRYASSGT